MLCALGLEPHVVGDSSKAPCIGEMVLAALASSLNCFFGGSAARFGPGRLGCAAFRLPLPCLLPKLLSTGIAICKKCFYRCLGICPGWVAASLRDADLHARLPLQQPRARLAMHPFRAAENNGPAARCAPCAGADAALPTLLSQSASQRDCAGLAPTREARAHWELGHRGTLDGPTKPRPLGLTGAMDLWICWIFGHLLLFIDQ